MAQNERPIDNLTCSRAMPPGSHPSSPRVHNTTCPSRRVALLPNDEGALPRPGRKADARAKRVGSPSPISPALFIPTSWPVSSAGNCKRSSRIARPCSPRNGSPTLGLARSPTRPAVWNREEVVLKEENARCQNARPSPGIARSPFAQSPKSFPPRRPRPNLERREVLPRPEASRPGGSRDLSFALRPAHLHPS